jgi:hypothetical protein
VIAPGKEEKKYAYQGARLKSPHLGRRVVVIALSLIADAMLSHLFWR